MTNLWTIVLAAGAGRRLAAVTSGAPKQFWRPSASTPSLLEATLARLYPVAVTERTVTVVDAAHKPYLQSLAHRTLLGNVLYQPMDRGTAAGVLLPLVDVLQRSPEAVIVLTPSDHGVEDDVSFRGGLVRAIARVRAGWSDVVLFGVEPSAIRADYGWITPVANTGGEPEDFRPVADFVEKPPLLEAFELLSEGAVWNTMVLVANARALLNHFKTHLPFLTDVMTTAIGFDPVRRDAFLRHWYPELPKADFSRDLLTASRPLSLYTWPAEIGWSDLGTPDRLKEWLALRAVAADTEGARLSRLMIA